MHPKALLDACAETVRQVLLFQHPADAVVSRFVRETRLGVRERATVADTAYTVLREKLRFESLARSGMGPRERRLAILAFQGPRDFLKSALTESEKHWLDACDAIDPATLPEPSRHNLPEWLATALRAQVGDEFSALAGCLLGPAPLDLRVNLLNARRTELREEMAREGLSAVETPYSPWGLRLEGKPVLNRLDAFTRGAIEVQDEGSQLLAWVLEARRGEMVVDFCAGAGGKTLAIGAAMRNTGRLYAFDTSAHRLDALKPRLARSGLSNVHPAAIAHERDERIKRLAGKMDRVLVDAPCSGLGTLRRSPDLKWRQSPKDIEELAARQFAILSSAARLVKAGGRLVYATCSLLTEENEAVAERFTQEFARAADGFRLQPMVDIFERLKLHAPASLCSGPHSGGEYLRLWPHRHGTDGFFAAAWERI